MNIRLEKSFPLAALTAGLGLMLTASVEAQTFTNLHGFLHHSEGAEPCGSLTISGGILYGTTSGGGSPGTGSVFAISTNGTGLTTLHAFAAGSGPESNLTNSDGSNPQDPLILSGNTLYGTASGGGINGSGTVFAVNTDSTGFTNLHIFTALGNSTLTNGDGAYVVAGLTLSGGMLYGTAYFGGVFGFGTVFALNTNGTGFTNLHSFTALIGNTNSDGTHPLAGLVISGNTLYGAASGGGTFGHGTVFAINTDGTGFTNLHNFPPMSGAGFGATGSPGTNSDGTAPSGSLVLSGNMLYGTAQLGGAWGSGTVYGIRIDGTGFTNIHNFTTATGSFFTDSVTNSDGVEPFAGLALSGNTLYGTTEIGGVNGSGTVFAVSTDGTGFTNLHFFTASSGPDSTNADGANLQAGLILSGNTLYGAASGGGPNDNGTLFGISLSPQVISLAPQLSIASSGNNVILSWPTNVAGFDYTGYALQSTTSLGSTNWSAVSPSPVVVNGQETVTNALSGTQMFYRLNQ